MHLLPLIQGHGFSATESGSVVLVMLVAGIAGRVVFGRLSDVIGAIPAYLAASLWQTTLVFFFTWVHDLQIFYVFAVIYGFGYGGVMTGLLTTTRSLTPASSRSSATGIILAFAWLGHAIGGYQGGLFFDVTGSYTLSFLNASLAGVFNLALVSLLFVTVRSRLLLQQRVRT